MMTNSINTVTKTRRLLIAGLVLIASLGFMKSNTAHASHGYINDSSAVSFAFSYGYYPESYAVYYDNYRPVHHYRHIDRGRHYVVHPGRHGRGGYKNGHKHHRYDYRGHRYH